MKNKTKLKVTLKLSAILIVFIIIAFTLELISILINMDNSIHRLIGILVTIPSVLIIFLVVLLYEYLRDKVDKR